jgi:uncharacterized membrane protein
VEKIVEGEKAGIPEVLAEGLGAPEALARAYVIEFETERAPRDKTTFGNVMRMIWAALGVGLLNVIFALPAFAERGGWEPGTLFGELVPYSAGRRRP